MTSSGGRVFWAIDKETYWMITQTGINETKHNSRYVFDEAATLQHGEVEKSIQQHVGHFKVDISCIILAYKTAFGTSVVIK